MLFQKREDNPNTLSVSFFKAFVDAMISFFKVQELNKPGKRFSIGQQKTSKNKTKAHARLSKITGSITMGPMPVI